MTVELEINSSIGKIILKKKLGIRFTYFIYFSDPCFGSPWYRYLLWGSRSWWFEWSNQKRRFWPKCAKSVAWNHWQNSLRRQNSYHLLFHFIHINHHRIMRCKFSQQMLIRNLLCSNINSNHWTCCHNHCGQNKSAWCVPEWFEKLHRMWYR